LPQLFRGREQHPYRSGSSPEDPSRMPRPMWPLPIGRTALRAAVGKTEAGQGGLTGQVVVLGRAAGEEHEGRVGAQALVVILVLVADEDAEDAGADHLREGVLVGGCPLPVAALQLGRFFATGLLSGIRP